MTLSGAKMRAVRQALNPARSATASCGDRYPLLSTPAYDYDVARDGSGFLVSMLNPSVSTLSKHVVTNWFEELRRLSAASPAR